MSDMPPGGGNPRFGDASTLIHGKAGRRAVDAFMTKPQANALADGSLQRERT